MKRIIWLFLVFFVVILTTTGQNFMGSEKPFSNPSFMVGTNFGQYFQTLYKFGKYDEMLNFTSKESIAKYGKERILKYYNNCEFGYKIKIYSRVQEGKYIILTYNINEFATNKIIRIKTIVENDSAKIVLNNLNIGIKN